MKNPPQIINKINTAIPLPCLPQVLVKLNRICNSPTPSPEDLTRLVTMDPALTMKILRLQGTTIPSESTNEMIAKSVNQLGAGGLKNVALFCLSNPLTNPLLWETNNSFNQYWYHSLRCAVLARTLAQRLQLKSSDDAYIAGLLHDVGKLLLWMNFKKDYEPLFKKSVRADSALPAENDSIGTNHCEAGWNLLRSLNVHPFLADAVLYHHFPIKEVASGLDLVKIIYAANAICYRREGSDHHELIKTLGLALKQQQLDRIIDESDRTTINLLKDVDLTVDMLLENQSPLQKERETSLFSIFGEFRELSIRHLTFDDPSAVDEPESLPQELLRSLKILFDITAAYFFAYDPGQNMLIGKPSGIDLSESQLDQVQLPVDPQGSLPALALTHQKIFDSFGYLSNDTVTIADEQLIHLLDTEGMLCLPLVKRKQWIGVICAGIDEPQFPLLWEQLNLLELFADQAADRFEEITASNIRRSAPEEIVESVGDNAIRRVIHEVNNPLGIVKNYLNVLSSKIGEHTGVKDEIVLIREEIERIPGIIAQLSKSQYKHDSGDEPVDINSILYDLSKLLTRSVLEHAKVTLNFSPDPRLPRFTGKKNNLIQVFINLLKNSVEAMPTGGNIYITTAFVEGGSGIQDGRIVVIIRDDGPGIPEDVLARLFEPGLSSKGPEHFGLGLSISKDIIDKYNGSMHCESHKDRGTTFRITLPVSNHNEANK